MPNESDLIGQFHEQGRMMEGSVDLYEPSPSIEGAVFQCKDFQVPAAQACKPSRLEMSLLGTLTSRPILRRVGL